jgi:hypothetical protein
MAKHFNVYVGLTELHGSEAFLRFLYLDILVCVYINYIIFSIITSNSALFICVKPITSTKQFFLRNCPTHFQLRNPKVNFHVYNSQTLDPIRSQLNPVNSLALCFSLTHLRLDLWSGLLPLGFPIKFYEFIYPHSWWMSCPPDHPSDIWWTVSMFD